MKRIAFSFTKHSIGIPLNPQALPLPARLTAFCTSDLVMGAFIRGSGTVEGMCDTSGGGAPEFSSGFSSLLKPSFHLFKLSFLSFLILNNAVSGPPYGYPFYVLVRHPSYLQNSKIALGRYYEYLLVASVPYTNNLHLHFCNSLSKSFCEAFLTILSLAFTVHFAKDHLFSLSHEIFHRLESLLDHQGLPLRCFLLLTPSCIVIHTQVKVNRLVQARFFNGPVTGMSHARYQPIDITGPFKRACYINGLVTGLLQACSGPVNTSFFKQSQKCFSIM